MHRKKIITIILSFAVLLNLAACKAGGPPSAQIISEAKKRTTAILDSLAKDENLIAGKPKFHSEYYDKSDQKYILEYDVPLFERDSSVTEKRISVYLKEKEGAWVYDFILEESYRGVLGR